jgi:hypothetical protein
MSDLISYAKFPRMKHIHAGVCRYDDIDGEAHEVGNDPMIYKAVEVDEELDALLSAQVPQTPKAAEEVEKLKQRVKNLSHRVDL